MDTVYHKLNRTQDKHIISYMRRFDSVITFGLTKKSRDRKAKFKKKLSSHILHLVKRKCVLDGFYVSRVCMIPSHHSKQSEYIVELSRLKS